MPARCCSAPAIRSGSSIVSWTGPSRSCVLSRTGPTWSSSARSGDVLAEASLFAAAYHCDAVATGPVRLRSIPVERVAAALEHRPELARSLAAHLAAEVQAARARAEIVSLKTVAMRLDAWLALKDEGLPPKGQWRGLAAEIGVSPEALYRELAARRG